MKKLNLNKITLIGIDTTDTNRIKIAFEICEKYANFADKKLITKTKTNYTTNTGIKVINTVKINSLEDYSYFMIKELNKYVETEFALVIQHDGFILNPQAWTEDFLNYDYVGSPWWFSKHNVGNGGFSLRSKKLLEILAKDKRIKNTHPEDVTIGRRYRKYLESKGIKFAPEKIAKVFSIEGFDCKPWIKRKYNKPWSGEFGFHGIYVTNIEK